MLSLQQLYTPENLVFFVGGGGGLKREREEQIYKLISLTFQETLPPPSILLILTSHSISPLAPGHEWTGWQRGRRGEDEGPVGGGGASSLSQL